MAYCDSVLKCLPDIKTMISLHQQLLAASGGVVKGCGQTIDESSLDPSDRLRNAGELTGHCCACVRVCVCVCVSK